MNFRFLNQFAVVAALVACQAPFLRSQGIRQQSYNTAKPFASVGQHSSESSPLGRVDESVGQGIELGSTGQFEGGPSASAALDQFQSSRSSGQRSALSYLGPIAGTGAQKPTAPRSSARMSYTVAPGSAAMMPTDSSLIPPRKQGTAIGVNSDSTRSRGASRHQLGHLDSVSQSAGQAKVSGGTRENGRQQRKLTPSESFYPNEAFGEGSLEKLTDPFLGPSTSGFEGFTTGFDFDQPCGNACSLRTSTSGEPHAQGSKERARSAEMPESQVPTIKNIYGPQQPVQPAGTTFSTKPY